MFDDCAPMRFLFGRIVLHKILLRVEECHIFSALHNLVKRLRYKVEDRENIVTLANKMFLGGF